VKSFVDYVSEKFLEFNNRANKSTTDVFRLNMAGSVMKSLIPAYVARGITAIDTVAMKSTIKACFYADSFIGEARKLDL